jgi:hypothetical protein
VLKEGRKEGGREGGETERERERERERDGSSQGKTWKKKKENIDGRPQQCDWNQAMEGDFLSCWVAGA